MPSTLPFHELVARTERPCGIEMSKVERVGVCSNGATAKSENGAPFCVV